MCNVYFEWCTDAGCLNQLPVHIADFCVSPDTVAARCHEHPPSAEEDGWDTWVAEGEFVDEDGLFLPRMYLHCTEADGDVSPNTGYHVRG